MCAQVEILQESATISICGVLRADISEVDSDDLHLVLSVSPGRIETVTITREPFGITVCLLDHTRRVMVTGMATFVAVKKRRVG